MHGGPAVAQGEEVVVIATDFAAGIEAGPQAKGSGVQHVAMTTGNIVGTVEALQRSGVIFLQTPPSYYDEVPERVGEIDRRFHMGKNITINMVRRQGSRLTAGPRRAS